ncbi:MULTISPECIES: phosphatase PAP2 family protein [unclassified Halobacteriovorax]|uniref:phosphatase PAP2 family protein n=1 Tax=unclassified Halobacteriovorax TaxID=2639665 RepID=UPI003999BAB9
MNFNRLPQLITALALLGTVGVKAKNLEVCDRLQKDIKIEEVDFQTALNDAQDLSDAAKHCKAARSYQLALVKDQKLALDQGVDIKLLNELYEGNYLNDYANFSLSLKKIVKNHPSSETIHYQLADLYNQNLPTDIKNMPIGNFVKEDGSANDIVNEAIMVQEDFLRSFPNSMMLTDIQSKLSNSKTKRLEKTLSDFKYEIWLNKKTKDKDIYEYQAALLMQELSSNEDSRIKAQALLELFELYNSHQTKLIDAKERMAQVAFLLSESSYVKDREVRNVLKDLKKAGIAVAAVSESVLNQAIQDSSEIKKSLLSDADLKELLKNKKGRDRSIFMPIEFSDSEKSLMLKTLGVVGVMMAFDRPLMDFVQDNKNDTLTTITDFTNNYGEAAGLVPLVGASMAIGLVFKNDQFKRAAVRSVGAVLIGQLATQLLKSLSSRARPREGKGPYHFDGVNFGRNNTSFSSGHSAGAWSVMTVFATEFKDTKIVPIAAYSLAALTSFARVYKNAHWFSDVTLGALIGWISGKLMYKLFDKKQDGPVTFTPVTGDLNGGAVTYKVEGQKDLRAWPIDYYKLVFSPTDNEN